jgi:N-alpha-acetyltransferase 30
MVDAPITYEVYQNEESLPAIMAIVDRDLSEPYNVFTYRYFLNNWPGLCFIVSTTMLGTHLFFLEFLLTEPCALSQASSNGRTVGTVVCKADKDQEERLSGYIAMLAVDEQYRHRGIGE